MSQLNLTISVKQPVNASLDLSDVKKHKVFRATLVSWLSLLWVVEMR